MKTKNQFLYFLIAFFFGSSLWAQQNTVSTGGSATGAGGTVSYSVGQIDYSSYSGSNGSIHQGVQQPLEFFNLSLPEQILSFEVLLFPNPTIAELKVQLKDFALNRLHFILTDATGKEVQRELILNNNFSINMVDLGRGSYYLNFFKDKQILGSYQVIKK